MAVRLYDTAQRAVVPFEADRLVRMYVCGITPYDSTHLGHAATYLTYDLLIRRLEDLGHEVHMVRNVTDVDDSILPKARELGIPYLELAEREIARFRADMDALEMRPPIAEPRATETIGEIVSMVERLLDSGHAYLTAGTAYFDVSTSPSFGALSHYSEEQMVRLARARVATRTTRTAARRSTSCCGSPARRTSRHGARRSASGGPAGTWSARRCRCRSSGRRSTSTGVAPT